MKRLRVYCSGTKDPPALPSLIGGVHDRLSNSNIATSKESLFTRKRLGDLRRVIMEWALLGDDSKSRYFSNTSISWLTGDYPMGIFIESRELLTQRFDFTLTLRCKLAHTPANRNRDDSNLILNRLVQRRLFASRDQS